MKPTVTKSTKPTTCLGIDLGDRKSRYCLLSVHGEIKEGEVAMTKEELLKLSKRIPRSYVVIETGGQSSWVSRLFSEQHHEVIVANARRMSRESNRGRKSDRADAKMLAKRGISDIDRANLYPVTPRSERTQIARAIIHTRDHLVKLRVSLKLRTKSLCKELGTRLPTCSTSSFPRKVRQFVPKALVLAIEPLLTTMESIDGQIREMDRELLRISERYPVTQVLQTVTGVGIITSLSFVLTIEDPKRFGSGRDVPAFLGLVPARHQSGKSDPQLSITKAGNGACRRLLVLASHYILGPKNKEESDLRAWGLKLAERGGKSGKKRAIVAVARKLSVILHRMWLTGEAYKPKINKAEQSKKRKDARAKKATKSAA